MTRSTTKMKEITQIFGIGVFVLGMVAIFLTIAAGPVFLFAWIADILYSNIFESDGAPQINYWYFVLGIMLVRFLAPMPTLSWKVDHA